MSQTEAQVQRNYVSEQEEEIRSNQPWIKVFFSILYHKWQTWIHPSNRCRKLLICSIWLSWLFYIFWLVGWFFGDPLPRGENICSCPFWFALRNGHTALQIQWLDLTSGHREIVIWGRTRSLSFSKIYAAPTSLISPDSKW